MFRTLLVLAVATALRAQMPPEAADTLVRAREKIGAAMRQLPKYACLQTVDRGYFTLPASPKTSPSSCGRNNTASKPRLTTADRVRLDVAEADGREIHSWPGASRFETGNIEELVNRGPISTGAFGGYLVDLFDNNGAQFDFAGEQTEGGRRIFTYSYRIAQDKSHYKIRADVGSDAGWVVTAYHGTFRIDAASLDLLRLTATTPELPPETRLCQAESSLDYARVTIGNSDFILPALSRLHMVNRGTLETDSTSVFTGCREYHAESAISFGDTADIDSANAAPQARPRPALPAGIRLTLHLDAAIDSDTAAAGDPLTARVVDAVRDPKSNAILFRPGALVRGRIGRMEHWLAPSPRFIVGIHWESISSGDDSASFAAIVDRTQPVLAPLPIHILQNRPMPIGLPDALTIPSDAKRHVVPAGFEMRWVTVTPERK